MQIQHDHSIGSGKVPGAPRCTRMGRPHHSDAPALSSISTLPGDATAAGAPRRRVTTVAIDWPGFGDAPRPAVRWQPDAYRAFLANVLEQAVERPLATVAAGMRPAIAWLPPHTTGTTGGLARRADMALVRLPTVMGKRHAAFVTSPAPAICRIGDLIYRLNVNPFMVRMMALGHVYRDPGRCRNASWPKSSPSPARRRPPRSIQVRRGRT